MKDEIDGCLEDDEAQFTVLATLCFEPISSSSESLITDEDPDFDDGRKRAMLLYENLKGLLKKFCF